MSGAIVKIEVMDAERRPIQVELGREQYERIRAIIGETVYVKPRRVRVFMQDYDYIVCPTAGTPAFRIDQPLPEGLYDRFLLTYAFSVTGLPAISVPCGFTQSGLPVGLQIVARRLREDSVLEAAAAYLRACPQHLKRPTIDSEALRQLPDIHPSLAAGPDWVGGKTL